MKSLKRLIATIIAFSMILSLSVFAAEFKDVEKGSTYEKAIDVLSDIGIVKGYEDGNYKPDKEVTRAEITSLLMRMINLSITGIEVPDSYYTDVASNHWAVYDIKTATDKGVIAGFGGGIFGPDRSVTYEQAVKMIVCLLGYEAKATDTENGYTGWPDGYMRVAREIGLLTNSQMNQKDNAPRKIIAQLLYNALEIQMVNPDGKLTTDSILKTYLQINKTSGMIVANSKTTLDNTESVIKEDEIQIQTSDGVISRYKVGVHTQAIDMLGTNVVAYTKLDDTRANSVILNIATQGVGDVVTVDAKDLITFTQNKLVYETDESTGRTKEISFNGGMKIVYNGKFIDTAAFFNSALKNIKTGEIKVTASSGISLVEITSYKNYVVNSVDTNNEIIYINTTLSDAEFDGTADGNFLTPYSNTVDWNIKFLKNNSEISMNSIRKGQVITVKATDATLQSSGANIIEVVVSDEKISGKITGTDENSVTIASKEYKLAPSLEANTTEKNKLVYDASGSYYLDTFGRIMYFELGASDSSSYGYIVSAGARASGINNTIVANVMEASSKRIRPLTFAEKYTIDGVPCTGSEGLDDLLNSANAVNRDITVKPSSISEADAEDYTQPIKYTLNNSGLVNSVTTVSSPDFATVNNGLTISGYKYSSNSLNASGLTRIYLDNSTIVFVVPDDRTKTEEYRVSTKGYFGSDISYKVEAFGKTSSEISATASVVVVYTTGVNTDLKYNSPLIVYNKQASNAEGDTVMYGFEFTSGNPVEYILEDPTNLSGIEKGDIVRFGTNASGEIAKDKLYKYLDVSAVASTPDRKYTSTSTATTALMNPANLPVRYITSYGTNASFNFYDNSSIEADRSDYRTYTLAMALNFNDDTNTLRYTTDYGTSFDRDTCKESGFEIKSDVDVFVYDTSAPESKVLSYVSDSVERENAIANIKTYDESNGAFDYVYLYGTADQLHAIMIVKNISSN